MKVSVVKVNGKPLFQRAICDMEVGEIGYTVPWAYEPETGELDTDFSIHEKPSGTVQLKVTLTIRGFVVDIVKEDYRW